MFGYVRIYKDDLKIRDYNIFRTYYCGLCRALGESCSQGSRMGLSYDFVFLAILLSALCPDEENYIQKPCIAHPLIKKKSVKMTRSMQYCAHMSVILSYLKMLDDWNDEKSIKALFGILVYARPFSKLKKQYSDKYAKMSQYMKELSKYEKEDCKQIDVVADCFAKLLEVVFTPDFEKDNERVLGWLGYNIGRWIYIIDAFSDIESDFKSKSYNPFLQNVKTVEDVQKLKKLTAEDLKISLTFTLENAASAYELLDVQKNGAILENILYLGLKVSQDRILEGKERNEEKDEPV